MTTGQTLLALAAISLFMYTAVSVNRTYVAATATSVEQQRLNDSVNFAQSVSEMVYAQAAGYHNIETLFLNASDIDDPARRIMYITSLEDTLYATVTFSPEIVMVEGAVGRIANISVFERVQGVMEVRVQSTAALIRPD